MEIQFQDPAEVEVALNIVRTSAVAATGLLDPTRSGIMVFGNILVGPNPINRDLIVKAQTPTPVFSIAQPHVIQLQPRQSDNVDYGFPDQFALMVIETDVDFIRFRIRRVDNGAQPTGWGQNLSIDVFCIDDGAPPEV